MNQPEPFKREYGFQYFCTEAEKKSAEPKRETDGFFCTCTECVRKGFGFLSVEKVYKGERFSSDSIIYRRDIDPDPEMPEGQKRWVMLTPSDFTDSSTDELTHDGIVWLPFSGTWHDELICDLCTHNLSIRAFRRPIRPAKFWMVLRLSNSSDKLQQVDSLPHQKYSSQFEAESDAQTLADKNPNAKGFCILESTGQIFKQEKSAAELAWDAWPKAACDLDKREAFIYAYTLGLNAAKEQSK